MDVSILIVNWNTREMTCDCLRSIYEQTREIRFEVILVDNASSDGSAEAIGRRYPQVTLIANHENRGFAAANNQAMAVATGRYVLLLNPDTIVLDGAIQKAVRFADDHPEAAVVGCQIWKNENEIQRTCFPFPTVGHLVLQTTGLRRLLARLHLERRGSMEAWGRDTQRDVEVVSGVFMLVRREALEQVGGMDEDYFIYAEETDWCWRFYRAGWRLIFTPTARIIHRDGGSKSTEQVSVRMFVQMQKSLLIFYRKCRGPLAWAAAKAVYIVSMTGQWIVYSLLSLFRRGEKAAKLARQRRAALGFHLFGIEPK